MSEAPHTSAPGADAADLNKKLRAHVDSLLARPAATRQASIALAGRTLDYQVHAAFLPVVAQAADAAPGEPEAAVLATAYLLQGAAAAQRPVCFAFNGGPGSASIWLHLGALGPKRLVVPDDGSMARAPYAVQDNPHT